MRNLDNKDVYNLQATETVSCDKFYFNDASQKLSYWQVFTANLWYIMQDTSALIGEINLHKRDNYISIFITSYRE